MGNATMDEHARLLAEVDADHRALAVLFEGLDHVCGKSANATEGCARCPAPVVEACDNMLHEITSSMLSMLLEHFEREDELMQRVAHYAEAHEHCRQHRAAHADFTTRYNRLATTARAIPADGQIGSWKAFIHDWAREHVLKFDVELARLARVQPSA